MNSLAKDYPKISGIETIYTRLTSFENPKCYDVSQDFDVIVSEAIIQDFPSTVYWCEESFSVTIGDDTPDGNFSYQWGSGEVTPTINVSNEGSYTVTISTIVSGLVCSESFSVTVVVSSTPTISTIKIDDLQENNTITIETVLNGNYEYQLDDGFYQNDPYFDNVLPGTHVVAINDLNGCGTAT